MHNLFLSLYISIVACVSALPSKVYASTDNQPNYFIFDGNPVAAKYVGGKLVRLPVQDADDVEGLAAREAVTALSRASLLRSLSVSKPSPVVHLSPPRMPAYGESMFEVSAQGSVTQRTPQPTLIWAGPASFREIVLAPSRTEARLKQRLMARSRRLLTTMLDFRGIDGVDRRLKIKGPVSFRDYGRTDVAPHLAFIDIIWYIEDLPDALANKGIDSWSPYMRVEYVVNRRTGKLIYQNTTNAGGTEGREMRIFKEDNGPLLMAVSIICSDGSEPILIDLERETYGTGRSHDIPESLHCFPAQ